MRPLPSNSAAFTRRALLARTGISLYGMGLATLLQGGVPHLAARARRVIFLQQSGGPSQMDLFDHKPVLRQRHGTELPPAVRGEQRITSMTSGQSSLPLAGSAFSFARHGKSGAWLSELLPHTAAIADELTFVRSVHTSAINHDPAITFMQTGSEQSGRPSMGAWLSYGLGSENRNLPSFVVLLSQANALNNDQPLYSRLWGAGFMPSEHQGARFRAAADPVLYLSDPPGITREIRREMLDAQRALNQSNARWFLDPEITTRIAQYELAFRMQQSVPELMDLTDEPESIFRLYGPDARRPGTFAANCLLARRLAERGVRFIQLYHRGWDQHFDLPRDLALQCQGTDQPAAALVQDLKQRGLLEDTLVVWGGEFGRTAYCQGPLTAANYGRDHHPRCFTMWLAGGGIKPGITYGETDEFSYNITRDPVSVHDLHATILHCLGLDHLQLTYAYQGRNFRLTDVGGTVVHQLLV